MFSCKIDTFLVVIAASPERIDHNDKIKMPSAVGSQQLQQQMHDEEIGIRDVWRHNLEDEFVLIRKVVNKYCYVSMDTEFPGKLHFKLSSSFMPTNCVKI